MDRADPDDGTESPKGDWHALGVGLVDPCLRLAGSPPLLACSAAHPSPSKNPAAHASSCSSTFQKRARHDASRPAVQTATQARTLSPFGYDP